MNLEKLVAISGRSGLFRMTSNRANGLIVEDLDNGKRFFVSARLHQFTPLASISIYTDTEEETVELKQVFKRMADNMETTPPLDAKAEGNELRSYFEKIMPEHDREKVLISDIKKLIKWFGFLKERNLLNFDEVEVAEEENNETAKG
jgi:hypothetical protein